MSTLTLVRHAQVASFEAGSDHLSERGKAQAQALAEWWIHNGVVFDEVYSGTFGRHVATEREVATVFELHRRSWPAPHARPGWNEYDAHGVLDRIVPMLAAQDKRLAALERALRESPSEDRPRHFQHLLEAAMLVWLEGGTAEGVEAWPAFRDRVRQELACITGVGGGGRRIAVFTSGGPIGVAVQTAMAAPDRSFLEVNWRVRNCSVTEFIFGGGRFTLDSFNNLAHLGPALHSWR